MKRNSIFLAGAIAGSLALVGCGEDTKTSSVDDARTATVALSVSFPAAAEAGKAVIPSYAEAAGFRYCRMTAEYNYQWCDLFGTEAVQQVVDRDNPTATVTLVPGLYMFGAGLFSDTTLTNMIDATQTAGEIVAGANTVKMSFLQGDWTFDASGAADPITLGDGTVVTGFKLAAYSGQMQAAAAAARKSAFDVNQPIGWMEYDATLKTSAGDLPAGWLVAISQFHSGNSNDTTLLGIDYNLTKNCAGDDYSEVPCEWEAGDWFVFMMGSEPIENMEEEGLWTLLPPETLTDGSGNPIDVVGDSRPTDGVTIAADFIEGQVASRTESVVLVGGAAKAAQSSFPRTREEALKQVLAASENTSDSAGKSVTTQTIGTVNNSWYDPVIAASGTGTDRGTWNFNDWVWDETLQEYIEVADGCLVTGGAVVYANCGYLESVWNEGTQTYEVDPGEFSWGFAPTDPTNLGEYGGCFPEAMAVGVYEPWCFSDQNSDGTVDMGSFQFTHYLKVDEVMNNVRKHTVTAKGAELPATEVILQ